MGNMFAGVTDATTAGGSGGLTLASLVGFFNIVAGLLLAGAILFFFAGLITWALRLGMVGRDQGVHYMETGVAMLFVLVVMLALIEFVQFHTQLVLGLLAIVVVCLVAWLAVTAFRDTEEPDDKH